MQIYKLYQTYCTTMISKNKIHLFEEFAAGEISRPEQSMAPAVKTDSTTVGIDKVSNGEEIRAEIIKDVDAILTNLETLSTRIQENLTALKVDIEAGEAPEDILEALLALNEAGDEEGKKVIDLIWHAPKARAAMKKVNKVRDNQVAIELAKDGLPKGDPRKEKLTAKADSAKKKADDLEKAVRDRFSDRTEVVKRAIAKTDIEGKLDRIKKLTGMEDDPKVKADLKTQYKEMTQKLKDEEAAMSDLTNDVDKQEVERQKQNIEDNGAPEETTPKTDKVAPEKTTTKTDKAAPKADKVSAAQKAKNDAKKDELKANKDKKDKDSKLSDGDKEKKKFQDEIDRLNDKIKGAEGALSKVPKDKKAEVQANIDKFKNQIKDLQAKKDAVKEGLEEDFDFDNAISVLESEIDAFILEHGLQELPKKVQLYEGMSIADRFRNLL